jgi:DNA-directed RNA polymerase subunit RPC12/RpoP
MDLIFNCPKCGQELAVDDSGAGEEISCPACSQKIRIPEPTPAGAPSAEAAPPRWGGPSVNAIASSAAAKIEKHLKVPGRDTPVVALITKPSVPLEVAAKTSDRQLRVKTIRHVDCVEVGHDKFDEIVGGVLAKIGDQNFISLTPLNYSHIDISSQKLVADYGVLILYRG